MNRAYAVIAGGLAIAAGLFIAILLAMPVRAQTDLVVEVAKAAIGLFPVVFFGVIVAELLKRRDDTRSWCRPTSAFDELETLGLAELAADPAT